MKIGGPSFDATRKGQKSPWYLSLFVPQRDASGTLLLDEKGNPVVKRQRTYYGSKALATADIPRIRSQYASGGAGALVMDRHSSEDYEAAKRLLGDIPMVEAARFWMLHHPYKAPQTFAQLLATYVADLETRGSHRHVSDVKSRMTAFLKRGFADRFPDSVTRPELLEYLKNGRKVSARTKWNDKIVLSGFLNWAVSMGYATTNPIAGLKKREMPKQEKKEIRFLSLDQVERYLRTMERYDPDLIAHEVIQLFAGVRSDDEMGNFSAEFVFPKLREVTIPAHITKTNTRYTMNQLEPNFWDWWQAYGPKAGLLRPKNYLQRWARIRYLMTIEDQAKADKQGALPIKTLLQTSDAKEAHSQWPWNARRRTFCTFHVAMHQSADKTALIMRHRGSVRTLHESYRGLGISQEDGGKYFELKPCKVEATINPIHEERGIIAIQRRNLSS